MTLAAQNLLVALGRRPVLSGIDVTLQRGRLAALVGPNGAGKTTLLRALAGLVGPQAGEVLWEGRPIGDLTPNARARAIAYLPQGGTAAWPLPVADLVALGRLPHGERPGKLSEEGRDAVARALAAVGLGGFERRPATELSGGERARALLARALATEAPVLLADEPVAALDPRHQLLVLDALRERARGGAVVAVVMHDLNLAARFADTVVMMDRGAVIASGPPRTVMTPERLAAVFGIEAAVLGTDEAWLLDIRRPLTA